MLQTSKTTRRIDTDALKRERPLVDVVASYGIALRRESAGTYRALCPFHQEHTPSFWIDMRGDADSHHYFCFGCLAHGDTITFVMEREGCSFQLACERLSTRARPPLVEPVQRISGRTQSRQWEQLSRDSVDAQVLEMGLEIYEKKLWQNARALGLFRKEGRFGGSRACAAAWVRQWPLAPRTPEEPKRANVRVAGCCGSARTGAGATGW
jgi:DNA primase